MPSRRTITRTGAVAVVGVAVTLATMQVLSSDRGAQARVVGDPAKSLEPQPIAVQVARPVRRPLTRVLNIPATLLPGESAELYAKTSGYAATVAVDIGSRVRKGDTLLTIDVPETADELRQAQAVLAAKRARVQALQALVTRAESLVSTAEADLNRSEAEFRLRKLTRDRKEKLWKESAISDQDYDEAQSEFEIAQARVDIVRAKVRNAAAELQAIRADVAVGRSEVAVEEANIARLKTLMEYATLTAPSDGVITARHVDPGAFIRSAAEGTTEPLLTIANVDYIRLVLQIPESDAPLVHVGTEVAIDVKALGGPIIEAAITRTAMALKADTRTMRAEVDLDNSDGRLTPGMYAQVAVVLESKQEALVIPSRAIRALGRGVFVLAAEGGVARSIPVKIGYDDGIRAEVLSGLAGHERVIVSAGSSVVAGAPVSPVPAGS